jgi:hypothetical protein
MRRTSGSAASAAAGPVIALRPSTRIVARGASASASSAFCSTMATATPSALMAAIVAKRSSAASGERPAEG